MKHCKFFFTISFLILALQHKKNITTISQNITLELEFSVKES